MPSIPVHLSGPAAVYGPALLALAVSLAGAWSFRAKGRQPWLRVACAAACLAGWGALIPALRWHTAVTEPRLGPEMLLAPAAVATLAQAVLAWRGGRNPRLIGFAAALFTGWWLARTAAGPGEFWRIWFVVAGLCGVVAWLVANQVVRGLACALALWGGLVVAGVASGWIVAACALAAAWAGPLALGGEAGVPAALMMAAIAGSDLAAGRVARGRLDATDLACLLALGAAPFTGALQARLGRGWGRFAPVSAAAAGAAAMVALGWVLRRALFA